MENIMPEDAQGRFVTGEMKNTENILYCGGVAMGYKCFDTNDYIPRVLIIFSIATHFGCYI